MIENRRMLVEEIHDTKTRLVLAIAGGGNAAITDLLDVPGASRTVLEIIVPYAEAALSDLVGRPIDGAVSQKTAEAMASACLKRAQRLISKEPVSKEPVSKGPVSKEPDSPALLGVGCTAALTTDRPKKGNHRAHIAIASGGGIDHLLVELPKGALDRRGEDRVVADVILDSIAKACAIDG